MISRIKEFVRKNSKKNAKSFMFFPARPWKGRIGPYFIQFMKKSIVPVNIKDSSDLKINVFFNPVLFINPDNYRINLVNGELNKELFCQNKSICLLSRRSSMKPVVKECSCCPVYGGKAKIYAYPVFDSKGRGTGIVCHNLCFFDFLVRNSMDNGRFSRVFFNNCKGEEKIFSDKGILNISGYKIRDFSSGRVKWDNLIVHDDISRVLHEREMSAGEGIYSVCYRIKDSEDNVRGIREEGVSFTLPGGGKIFVLGTVTDITGAGKQRDDRDMPFSVTEKLIHLDKMAAMGQMASGMFHELNQPLTGIKGFVSAALININDKDSLRKGLIRVMAQVDRMEKMLRQAVSFSRRSGYTGEVDINKSVEDSLDLLSAQLGTCGIQLKKSFLSSLPRIKGDANRLQQVFCNLIINAKDAIKCNYTDRGELSVKTNFNENNGYIEIVFQDNGCGISRDSSDNIFEPFFTTKPYGKGTGLGLSIARQIVTEHGGYMEVESKEGEGTLFRIKFPCE